MNVNQVIRNLVPEEIKTVEINCNMFMPMLEPCRVMIAGSGSAP